MKKKYRIHVEGEESSLVTNFSTLGKKYQVDKYLMENVGREGYKKPTPVQMASIPLFFEEKNLLIIAPTGSGKTLSYSLPLLTLLKKRENDDKSGVKAVVLAPSLELAS